MVWYNDDGLRVKFNTEKATVGRAGEFGTAIEDITIEVDVVYSDLNDYDDSTDPTTILDHDTRIPPGAFLKSAEFIVETAFDSAADTATLSFGLCDASDMEPALTHTGALSATGIDATIAETSIDAEGDTITCDGANIGTTLPTTSDSSDHKGGFLITAEQGTENFTAGKGKLVVKYRVPVTTSST